MLLTMCGGLMKKWPFGSIVLTALLFLLFLNSIPYAGGAAISGPPDVTISEKLIRWVYLLSPLCFLISTIGIFMLKPWARIFTIVLSTANILFLFLSNHCPITSAYLATPLVISFLIIGFLIHPVFKERFK